MNLGVCLMGRDERTFLERSLPAARAVADYLVYLDTGSTDGSIEYASKIADIIIRIKPRDLVNRGFAWARNLMSSVAVGTDWLYHVDADEMLSEEQRPLLREIMQTTAANAVQFRVLTFEKKDIKPGNWSAIANKCKWDESRHVRLYRNVPWIKWRGYIHEELFEQPDPSKPEMRCFDTKFTSDLKHLHFTKYRDGAAQKNKEIRFGHMLYKASQDRHGLGSGMNDWWWDNWFPPNLGQIKAQSAEYLRKADAIDPE